MRPLLPLLALLLAAGLLSGCMEVEEAWTFDDRGGGTYALDVRWNPDLWRRVSEVLGPKVMGRLVGRPFPLRSEQWRDGLRGLDGVEVLELGESDTDGGLRQIAVRLKFRHVRDLMGWELLARRSFRIEAAPEKETGKGKTEQTSGPVYCHLHMEPLTRVPVLDRLAALLNAVEQPPPKAEGAAAERDPAPLERLGLERAAAEMVWRMLKLPLRDVKLAFRFRLPGDVTKVRGKTAREARRRVDFRYEFAALRKPETIRSLDFSWRTRELDQPPVLDHQGDRLVRKGGPHGRKR